MTFSEVVKDRAFAKGTFGLTRDLVITCRPAGIDGGTDSGNLQFPPQSYGVVSFVNVPDSTLPPSPVKVEGSPTDATLELDVITARSAYAVGARWPRARPRACLRKRVLQLTPPPLPWRAATREPP